VAQVVECLPNWFEAMNSVLSTDNCQKPRFDFSCVYIILLVEKSILSILFLIRAKY
jgi:hypothetical protein